VWTTSCSDVSLDFDDAPANFRTGFTPCGQNQNVVIIRTRSCDSVVPSGDACLAAGDCGAHYNCWDHGMTGQIALTTTTMDNTTGEIVDADMEFNGSADGELPPANQFAVCADSGCAVAPDAGPATCGVVDLETVAMHEFGHFLGLAHSSVTTAAMASLLTPCSTRRALAQDDVDGICAVYPKAGATAACVAAVPAHCPAPDGGSDAGPSDAGAATDGGRVGVEGVDHCGSCNAMSPGALWLMGLLALRARRRRPLGR
jgi:hypothetical protein